LLAFWVNAKLNKYHRPTPALIAAIALILTAAGAVQAALSQVLPNVAITKASFQTMPAPAAYFKNIVLYFLPLALVFMILPFHIVQVLQASRSRQAASNQTETDCILSSRTVFIPPRLLWILLWFSFVLALALASHLFDGLMLELHTSTFIQLAYGRGVLFFGVAIECALWYQVTLKQFRGTSPLARWL